MKKYMLSFLILSWAYLLASCSGSNNVASENPDVLSEQEAFRLNKARWESANIQTYQYIYNFSCFCVLLREDAVVIVTNGEVTSAFFIPSGEMVDASIIELLPTIDELFNFIEEGIDDPQRTVNVSYDETLGYPLNALIEGEGTIAADDGIRYLARELQ